MEIGESVVEFLQWHWQKKSKPFQEDERRWTVPVSIIGVFFVILGVAGEGYFEARQASAETAIREYDECALAGAQETAAQAQLDAAKAREDTVHLGKDTQGLKTEAERQKSVAAKAEASAENERIERLKLEAQISPRRLTPDQETQIGDSLRAYAGKTVGVATYSQDVEAIVLAVQIEQVLGKANILVHDRIGTFGAVGLPLSLGVVVDTSSSDKKLESTLLDAFITKGKLGTANAAVAFGQGSTMYMPALPAGSTHEDAFVFVGGKPIAFPPEATAAKSNTNIKP